MAKPPKYPKRPKDLDQTTLDYVDKCLEYQAKRAEFEAKQQAKNGNYTDAAICQYIADALRGDLDATVSGDLLVQQITATLNE